MSFGFSSEQAFSFTGIPNEAGWGYRNDLRPTRRPNPPKNEMSSFHGSRKLQLSWKAQAAVIVHISKGTNSAGSANY